jgi:putative ABC transport system permease protein
MFKSYVLTAFRALNRQRGIAIINIAGFSIGLAVCFLIVAFVSGQLSYDKWLSEGERVYRLESTTMIPGRAPKHLAMTSGIAHDFLLADFPEVENVVRALPFDAVFHQEGSVAEQELYEVDKAFFSIFPLEFEEGSADTALPDINALVMTRSAADIYFGPDAKIGDTIEMTNPIVGERLTMKLTGILKNLPENTHLDFEILGLFDAQRHADRRWVSGSWFSRNLFTYIKLRPLANIAQVNARLEEFILSRVDISGSRSFAGLEAIDVLALNFVPFQDIYLESESQQQMGPIGSLERVYGFAAIAALILTIASVNFVNMTTARASLRAREVSLRRVVGAGRVQLVIQFLGEALIISFVSFVVALVIVELTLPLFNILLDSGGVATRPDAQLYGVFAFIALGTGLLSGLYPAFVLSSFRPAQVLNSGPSASNKGDRMRTALVVFQFAISVGLISATLVVRNQIILSTSIDLGFRTDNMLMFNTGFDGEAVQTLTAELARRPDVEAVTAASSLPTSEAESQASVTITGSDGPTTRLISYMSVDYNFLDVLEINLIAGRKFNRNIAEDTYQFTSGEDTAPRPANIVINRSALPLLGYASAEDAIGSSMLFGGGGRELTITGVVDDVIFRSLRTAVRPTIYIYAPERLSIILVRHDPAAAQSVLEYTIALSGELRPAQPIEHFALSEQLAVLYAAERQQMRILTLFAILAIGVATLGVFGLALFTAERKAREVAIRKILGARVLDIVRLLTWQFSKPVLLANLIAWPVAWYLMSKWLENFAYRVDVNVLALLVPSIVALLIAWATVGGHAVRVARTNPINALRYE